MHPELLRLSSLRVPVCTQVRYKEKVLQQPRDPRIRFAYGNIDWYMLGNWPWHPGIVQVWGFHTLFSVRTVPVCISVSLPISLLVSSSVSVAYTHFASLTHHRVLFIHRLLKIFMLLGRLSCCCVGQGQLEGFNFPIRPPTGAMVATINRLRTKL